MMQKKGCEILNICQRLMSWLQCSYSLMCLSCLAAEQKEECSTETLLIAQNNTNNLSSFFLFSLSCIFQSPMHPARPYSRNFVKRGSKSSLIKGSFVNLNGEANLLFSLNGLGSMKVFLGDNGNGFAPKCSFIKANCEIRQLFVENKSCTSAEQFAGKLLVWKQIYAKP